MQVSTWFLLDSVYCTGYILDVNVKVKSLCFFLTEHQAMKAYWGVEA
jgi:hypothetical protein